MVVDLHGSGPSPIDQAWSEPLPKVGVWVFLKKGSLSKLGSKTGFGFLKRKEQSWEGGLSRMICRKSDGLSFSKKKFVEKLIC